MVTKVRGRFTGVTGTVEIAEDLRDSRVDVTIDMATVESGNDDPRRAHPARPTLRRRDHPHRHLPQPSRSTGRAAGGTVQATSRSTASPSAYRSRPIFEGYPAIPGAATGRSSRAGTRVDREDFDLTWNVPLEAGGLLVSNQIQIEINLETVLRSTGSTSRRADIYRL